MKLSLVQYSIFDHLCKRVQADLIDALEQRRSCKATHESTCDRDPAVVPLRAALAWDGQCPVHQPGPKSRAGFMAMPAKNRRAYAHNSSDAKDVAIFTAIGPYSAQDAGRHKGAERSAGHITIIPAGKAISLATPPSRHTTIREVKAKDLQHASVYTKGLQQQ